MGACSYQQAIFVKMFRRWASAREAGLDRRLAMTEAYRGPGTAMMAAVAADSLFELVEAHLGRELAGECCCNPALGRDEAALLGLLHYAASVEGVSTGPAMPHGLSGAICWAAKAVRRELGFPRASRLAVSVAGRAARCPFRPEGEIVPPKGFETQASVWN